MLTRPARPVQTGGLTWADLTLTVPDSPGGQFLSSRPSVQSGTPSQRWAAGTQRLTSHSSSVGPHTAPGGSRSPGRSAGSRSRRHITHTDRHNTGCTAKELTDRKHNKTAEKVIYADRTFGKWLLLKVFCSIIPEMESCKKSRQKILASCYFREGN